MGGGEAFQCSMLSTVKFSKVRLGCPGHGKGRTRGEGGAGRGMGQGGVVRGVRGVRKELQCSCTLAPDMHKYLIKPKP